MNFETQTFLRRFNEWLQKHFTPSDKLGFWKNRETGEELPTDKLQGKFLADCPDMRGFLGKVGLLIILAFACFPAPAASVPAQKPGVVADSSRVDTLSPLAFTLIHKPVKSTKQ
jgi:hypothetical protein